MVGVQFSKQMAPTAMAVATDEPRKTYATSPTSINTEYICSKASSKSRMTAEVANSPSTDYLRSKSSKASSKSRMNSEDLAAMRHFRSVVESRITSNENISSSERKNNLANAEQLFTETEQRSHYHEKNAHATVGAGGVEKKTKKQGWMRSILRGKQDKSQTNVDDKKKPSKEIGWVLEKINEEAHESRGDVVDDEKATTEVDVRREEAPTSAGDETDSIMELRTQISETFSPSVCSLRSLGTFEKDFINNMIAEQANVEGRSVSTDEKATTEVDVSREEAPTSAGDETDSIMELRMQNSETFASSVCSLRSLGTFEKDFINNIIAEQANVEGRSVSTFEQDITAKMNSGVPYPTQVFMSGYDPAGPMDDLTIDTMLSETTFEKDARFIINNCNGGDASTLPLKLPTQVTAPSGQPNASVDEDDITIGTFRSETTYERDVRKMNEYPQEETMRNVGSAPTTSAVFDEKNAVKGIFCADSQSSISIYEKDVAALYALADKIGRKPPKQTKVAMESIMSTASDRSRSTFEQDVAFHKSTKAALRAPEKPYGQVTMTKLSDLSVSTFEKDYGIRSAKPENVVSDMPPPQISQSMSPITEPGSPTGFENAKTELTHVNQNFNPEWFNGYQQVGSRSKIWWG